jgi:hypothetical protein
VFTGRQFVLHFTVTILPLLHTNDKHLQHARRARQGPRLISARDGLSKLVTDTHFKSKFKHIYSTGFQLPTAKFNAPGHDAQRVARRPSRGPWAMPSPLKTGHF